MSKRKRTRGPPVRYEQIEEKRRYNYGDFSEEEDMNLFAALIKYGPLDIPQLCNAVSSRSEFQIKQRMTTLQKKAQCSLTMIPRKSKGGNVAAQTRDKVALDKWLEIVETEHQQNLSLDPKETLPVQILSRAMGFIAKYEAHPSPSESQNVNFRSVYEFIECMLMGVPSKRLSLEDSKFLLDSLQRLSLNLDVNETGRETSFIACSRPKWITDGNDVRTYGRSTERRKRNKYAEFLASRRLNPFCVPASWLEKKLETISSVSGT